MAIKSLSKNWSTALWNTLEPRTLLSAVIGGLRLALNKLGGISNLDSNKVPVGLGDSYKHVTVKLSDISKVGGMVSGNSSDNPIAGGETSEYIFRIAGLPQGILLFSRSATTASDVLTRGIDFIEVVDGCYRFKADPSFIGVCSYSQGIGYCSWLCTIGTPTSTANQDRLKNYKGSCNYRVNSKLSNIITAAECSNGISADALLVCCGTDIADNPDEPIVASWYEGKDKYCRTVSGEVVKIATMDYCDAELCNNLLDLGLSRTLLYAAGHRYYSLSLDNTRVVDFPKNIKPFEDLTGISLSAVRGSPSVVRSMLSMKGFNTVDTSGLIDRRTAALTLPYISKTSTIIPIQQLSIRLNAVDTVSELILYYTTDSETTIYDIAGDSLNQCTALADVCHGAWMLGPGEPTEQGNLTWCSLNGSTIGLRPSCGCRLIGLTAIQKGSPDDTTDDILEHMNIVNEFIHPGECIVITSTFK